MREEDVREIGEIRGTGNIEEVKEQNGGRDPLLSLDGIFAGYEESAESEMPEEYDWGRPSGREVW